LSAVPGAAVVVAGAALLDVGLGVGLDVRVGVGLAVVVAGAGWLEVAGAPPCSPEQPSSRPGAATAPAARMANRCMVDLLDRVPWSPAGA
jgi:hypothetical protein